MTSRKLARVYHAQTCRVIVEHSHRAYRLGHGCTCAYPPLATPPSPTIHDMGPGFAHSFSHRRPVHRVSGREIPYARPRRIDGVLAPRHRHRGYEPAHATYHCPGYLIQMKSQSGLCSQDSCASLDACPQSTCLLRSLFLMAKSTDGGGCISSHSISSATRCGLREGLVRAHRAELAALLLRLLSSHPICGRTVRQTSHLCAGTFCAFCGIQI